MTWSELRKKCKRQSDYIITLFITNEISLILTFILVKTRVTPNQVTVASILCGFFCGLYYAFGWFIPGSIFLFISHILDCTDGNLARVKEMFSPFGKWLDMVGDRISEFFIFMGVCIYFMRAETQVLWIISPLIDALILVVYFYIVDISLTLGISKPKQNLTALRFKNVNVKWGIMEPVLYGFIILAPLGLVKIQIIFIMLITIGGLIYQAYKKYSLFRSMD